MQEIISESTLKKLQVKILQNITTTKDNFQKNKNNFFPEKEMRSPNKKNWLKESKMDWFKLKIVER